jgi:hypothetical protein
VILFALSLQHSDKDKLDFGVVVSGTSLYRPEAMVFCPSKAVPPRKPDEHQAWISVKNDVLEKPLEQLKLMVLNQVHFKPGITKVLSVFLYFI